MKAIRNSEGFTLIELLVVVAIIGILAAIAIPQFALYRQRGFDARAESDLRNAATAEEARVAAGSAYTSCTSGTDCESKLEGFHHSSGVNMAMTAAGAAFTGTSHHTDGSARTWTWLSASGGLQP